MKGRVVNELLLNVAHELGQQGGERTALGVTGKATVKCTGGVVKQRGPRIYTLFRVLLWLRMHRAGSMLQCSTSREINSVGCQKGGG